MKKPANLLVLVVALTVLLAGCKGGPSTTIRVTMTDFAFTPSSFTVPAGQPISVQLTNNGAATHSFIIMKAGHDIQSHFTDADKQNVYWEVAAVAPGESATQTFTAPSDPGEYQIVCGIPAHFEAGMTAKLMVVSAP